MRPYRTENFYAFLNRKEEKPIADTKTGSKAPDMGAGEKVKGYAYPARYGKTDKLALR